MGATRSRSTVSRLLALDYGLGGAHTPNSLGRGRRRTVRARCTARQAAVADHDQKTARVGVGWIVDALSLAARLIELGQRMVHTRLVGAVDLVSQPLFG